MAAKRIYGNKSIEIKNFVLNDGNTAYRHSKKPLRRRIQGDLSSGKGLIYTNVEKALEPVSDGSLGGLWIMP